MVLKRMIYFFVGLVLLLFLSACSSMYIPSMPSLPLLEEKGDVQLEFSASTNSLRLSGNYAFSKKIALMVNGNLSYKNFTNYYDFGTKEDFVQESAWDIWDHGEFAHKYLELGFGGINILNKAKVFKTKLLFEIFGGMGYGHATDQKWGSPLKYEASYYLAFIQPNIGLSFNKFAFGYGTRLATSFYDYTYQTHSNYGYPNNEILNQSITFSMFIIEPTAMIRVGGPHLKFTGQFALSLPFPFQSLASIDAGKGIDDGVLKTTNIHISIGIHYGFGKRKNKELNGN